MKILVTNDDGYQSEGIEALIRALEAVGHEVWVCAPSVERSAFSHAMTLGNEVTLTKVAPMRYHCSGTPVDSILYATRSNIFGEMPDLVISGINHGYNISTDILYSGTVGAAREAALANLPSIAVSCSRDKAGNFDFEKAAAFVIDNLETFVSLASAESVININIPANANGKWKSAVPAYLDYNDVFDHNDTATKGDTLSLRLKGPVAPTQRCDTRESDFQVVNQGYASVTALAILPPVNLSVQDRLARLSKESSYA